MAMGFLHATEGGAQQGYRVGPTPRWVKTIQADLTPSPPGAAVTGGYEMLLIDRQEAVRSAGQERFYRAVYRLLDEGAVNDNSAISISFDPGYERLTLHTVTVTRNGKPVNQLKASRIRVVEPEGEMDSHIFNGSKTLVLVLEDIKAGDIVEYSFTREGTNPVFAGHYMAVFTMQETVALRHKYFRLLWPQGRPLSVSARGGAAAPTITDAGPQREYLWSAANVAPRVLDANIPNWYDPLPIVRLNDFGSWGEVAAWGDSLFASPGSVPAPLAARIATIRSESTDLARAMAALRFVQDNVRYFGIEIGVNSHQPFPVATVVKRGYGDCKDKAQLLVVMLRALGMPAYPALVSTALRGHVGDFPPGAGRFDHAIVLAEIAGREYWLDPTALYQRGPLENLAPGFGTALVLGRGAKSLTPIPAVPGASPAVEVGVFFELAGVGKPATMRVESRYGGRVADAVRDRTRGSSPEKLSREYTEYYAAAYPGIAANTVPQTVDDEIQNVVRTTERYTIPNFWRPSSTGSGYVGTLDPIELDAAIPSLTATGRTTPLAVVYPNRYRYEIKVHLAQGWSIAPRADTVLTPAIRFVRQITPEAKTLVLRYEYETLADHVSGSQATAHLEKLSQIRGLLNYGVTPPNDKARAASWLDPGELNWPILLAALFAIGLALVGVAWIGRTPAPLWPGPPFPPNTDPELTGLGGWLVFVGLGLSVGVFNLIKLLATGAPAYTASAWARLTAPSGASYHPLWAPTLLLELVVNLVLLVFGGLLLWYFLRRKQWFPILFAGFLITRTVFAWIDAILAANIPGVSRAGWSGPISILIASVVWVSYLAQSRRVGSTFVN